ncbi:hypothetical protein V1514DRAFT_323957 [Lipomyces japonicus]|uniref:uncharacterized protein n=1 Tax=Lipomyces japonicus TaxID=56871 RepID=UPI0034CDC76D
MARQARQVSMFFGVLVVPNPNKGDDFTSSDATTVPEALSFRLSVQKTEIFYQASKDNGVNLSALLYVPELATGSSCGFDDLPANVTHKKNLPAQYNIVALAPLMTPTCAQQWMTQAHHDGAQDVIFYRSQDLSAGSTPNKEWIGTTTGLSYSVYYIDSTEIGNSLVNYLSEYSGNMTGVPNGSQLTQYFDSRDYVRVATEIDNPSTSNLPGLWIFLVIAFGVLLSVAVSVSIGVHLLQYRNRRRLRQRIENGEVDLEALGIKRLTVPKSLLQKLAVRVYVPGEHHFARQSTAEDDLKPNRVDDGEVPVPHLDARHQHDDHDHEDLSHEGYSQSSCAICLEDFVPNLTMVRELPCFHIYHVDCIDPFLEHQSSLCPLCKQSILPKGYIPSSLHITNATVRRERRMRRNNTDLAPFSSSLPLHGRHGNEAVEMDTLDSTGTRITGTLTTATTATSTTPAVPLTSPPSSSSSGNNIRRLEQQQQQQQQPRATAVPGALVASDGTVFVIDREHHAPTGIRKVLHIMFPYFY